MISVSFFTPIRWGVLSGNGHRIYDPFTSGDRRFAAQSAGLSPHIFHAQTSEISLYFCNLLQFTKIHFLRPTFFRSIILWSFKIRLPWHKRLCLRSNSRPRDCSFSSLTPSTQRAFSYFSFLLPLAMIPADRLRAQGLGLNDRRQG